jgi:hypothetical protein
VRFGGLAGVVRSGVVRALVRAQQRAVEAQSAAATRTRQPYGQTRYPAQFEEFVRELGDLPGATAVRPHGQYYQLVQVAGNLLWPFHFADDLQTPFEEARVPRPVARLTRELFTRFGSLSPWVQPALFDVTGDDPVPERADPVGAEGVVGSDGAAAGTAGQRLVLVPYASAATGLLRAAWGEAALREDGTLSWSYYEPLPLPHEVAGGV